MTQEVELVGESEEPEQDRSDESVDEAPGGQLDDNEDDESHHDGDGDAGQDEALRVLQVVRDLLHLLHVDALGDLVEQVRRARQADLAGICSGKQTGGRYIKDNWGNRKRGNTRREAENIKELLREIINEEQSNYEVREKEGGKFVPLLTTLFSLPPPQSPFPRDYQSDFLLALPLPLFRLGVTPSPGYLGTLPVSYIISLDAIELAYTGSTGR